MNRIYLNIAGAITVASLIGAIVFATFVKRTIQATEERLSSRILDDDTAEAIDLIESSDRAEWGAIIERANEQGADILSVRLAPERAHDEANLGPHVREGGVVWRRRRGDHHRPRGWRRHGPKPPHMMIEVPIKGGAYLVEVEQPHYLPPYLPVVVFVVLLVVLSTLMVGWPLIRRMKKLEQAIDELGQGNLDVRLDDSEGMLGPIARRLNESASSLQSMFAEREELLQAVSHELGTPIARIKFQIELARPHCSEPGHARLDAINDDLEELRSLSKELVSWLDAGRSSLERQRIDVSELVETLVELAREFDTRELDIELSLPDDAPIVMAEPRLFQRALENLLSNAQRYTNAAVRVMVSATATHALITVEDDGPGIPEADRARVFEPFVRLEGSRSRDFGGVGLGMAITGRIIATHEATIEISDSELGGARIETSWPLALEA